MQSIFVKITLTNRDSTKLNSDLKVQQSVITEVRERINNYSYENVPTKERYYYPAINEN